MLGRLRISIEECIEEYSGLGEFIFSDRNHMPNSAMFKASKLEEALKKVIKKRLGADQEDAPLVDPLGNDGCKTFVHVFPTQ
jgi:hypothetical protein